MTSFKYINYKEENKTAIISINRPEVYNALNIDAKFEIIQAIREANKTPQIASIILTGEGKAFCTGQDLNDRSIQVDNATIDLGHTLETEWNPLVNAIRNSKKIVIGAINGVCAGAGVSVALACDLTVSSKDTKFVAAFSRLGLAPDAGATYIFTRAIGPHKTMEFFLLGEPLLGEELYNKGMINKLNDPSLSVLEEAQKMSETLASLPPLSLEMIKKNVKSSLDSSFETSMEMEKYTQRFLGNSSDYKEGLSSFLAKRKPQFTGN